MAYFLKQVTIRTNNSDEGIQQIAQLWQDINSGKIPLLFDSDHNPIPDLIPIVEYSNYENAADADYDMSIKSITPDFLQKLEQHAAQGFLKKYEAADAKGNIHACTQQAWEAVWADQRTNTIKRTFTLDYESTVPAEYSPDGQAHCYLYIAIKK